MKFATLMLLALVVTQGCATAPLDVRAHDGVQQITWTRGVESAAFRDHNGVCHTFSQDAQAAMHVLGGQLKACFEGGLPIAATTASAVPSVKVAMRTVAAERIDALFAEATGQSVLHAAGRRKTAMLFAVRGFYVQRGDTCHVVVSNHDQYLSTLGHEFKHCVDGEYHDARGVWRQHRAG